MKHLATRVTQHILRAYSVGNPERNAINATPAVELRLPFLRASTKTRETEKNVDVPLLLLVYPVLK